MRETRLCTTETYSIVHLFHRQGIAIREELTDEWEKHRCRERRDYEFSPPKFLNDFDEHLNIKIQRTRPA